VKYDLSYILYVVLFIYREHGYHNMLSLNLLFSLTWYQNRYLNKFIFQLIIPLLTPPFATTTPLVSFFIFVVTIVIFPPFATATNTDSPLTIFIPLSNTKHVILL